mgnify:CR=1 FL=1
MRNGIIILFLGIIIFMNLSLKSDDYTQSMTFDTVYVRSGESVWSIASRYVSGRDDVRCLVAAIMRVNNLDENASIYSGQTLMVPLKTAPVSYKPLEVSKLTNPGPSF